VQLKSSFHPWVKLVLLDYSNLEVNPDQSIRAKHWEEKVQRVRSQDPGFCPAVNLSLWWIRMWCELGHYRLDLAEIRGSVQIKWHVSPSAGLSPASWLKWVSVSVCARVLVWRAAEQLETIRALTSPLMDLYWHGAALVSGKPKGTCH